MKVYWYIEDNKFKLEHIAWFRNGGAYTGVLLFLLTLLLLFIIKIKNLGVSDLVNTVMIK